MQPRQIVEDLSKSVSDLEFGPPVTHVYNPACYAKVSLYKYLDRYCSSGVEVLFLGMNPGPWGMAQTGVPFGDVSMVRDWMGIHAAVDRPRREHPKRLVTGFDCPKREVSGSRLWGWAAERFGTPDRFFSRFFVWNYCPLSFMVESGRNHTPDKLPASERDPLFERCDEALRQLVECIQPERVIGVGKFAERRAREALGDAIPIGTILHPSPASPAANRDWAGTVERQLREQGVSL